jgi:hypothetical protein
VCCLRKTSRRGQGAKNPPILPTFSFEVDFFKCREFINSSTSLQKKKKRLVDSCALFFYRQGKFPLALRPQKRGFKLCTGAGVAGAIIRKLILPFKIPEHQKTFLFGELCFVWAFSMNGGNYVSKSQGPDHFLIENFLMFVRANEFRGQSRVRKNKFSN